MQKEESERGESDLSHSIDINFPPLLPVLGVTGTNRHWYARRCSVRLIKVKNESGERRDSLSVSSEGTIWKLHGREKASGGPPSCDDSLSRDSFGKRALKIYA